MTIKHSGRNALNRRTFITASTATAVLTRRENKPLSGQISKAQSLRKGISDQTYQRAWRRAAALVNKMTLAEMVDQVGSGIRFIVTPANKQKGMAQQVQTVWLWTPGIKRLGIPEYPTYSGEALHGLCRLQRPVNNREVLAAHGKPLHHLNYPTIATSFPLPLAMVCSWNPALAHLVYTAVSDEARAYHKQYHTGLNFYSPLTLNLHRDPRWGRCEEAPGEDPCLASSWAVQVVRGMQGDDPNYLKTTACAKHFICNNTDDDRWSVSASVNSRNFWEYYTRAYRACVLNGDVFTAMSAYNAINGLPCSADHFLLTDLLRKRWGFRGYVTGDANAIHCIFDPHHYVPTLHQAAAVAMQAGCDSDLGNVFQEHLMRAVDLELVSEADIHRAVTRLLTVRMLLGEFDPPTQVPYNRISFDVVNSPAHQKLALDAARQSIVLLKNTDHFLPLNTSALRKVAVIGPMAGFHLGGYSGAPVVRISPLDGITAALNPAGVTVLYELGCSIAGPKDNKLFNRALVAAKKADVVIMICGVDQSVDAEVHDRKTTNLPGVQHELIQACYKANPKTVLLLNTNNTVAINWEQENIPAIVAAIFAGQAQGTAIADVLFGNYNPGGKTCCTWYKSVDQLPPFHNYDIMKGRTYMYFEGEPLYPFGYGLSYTTFQIHDLHINAKELLEKQPIQVACTVKNTGTRAGAEVVQFYVTVPKSPVKRPLKELVGFQRVELQPGESRRVTFTLPYTAQALWYWHESQRKFVLQPGTLKLMIGHSSADIDLTGEIHLKACTNASLGGPETLLAVAVSSEIS